MRRGNFEGKAAAKCKVWGLSAVSSAKTAELIVWDVDSGRSKEARIRWGCTLTPSGEYS